MRALGAYLNNDHPAAGPLFLDRTNTRRLAYTTALGQIQRLAAMADIPAAAEITPHSLRHTFVTEALAAGVPLQDGRTQLDIGTPGRPGATTAAVTTSDVTRPTFWPLTCDVTAITTPSGPAAQVRLRRLTCGP